MNQKAKETKTSRISAEALAVQRSYAAEVYTWNAAYTAEHGIHRKYFVQTFGCQQNEADSERLAGMAVEMGYLPAECANDADLILINTCAVREHAEKRALSITGQFKHLKEKKPDLIIAIGGCMVSQEKNKERIKHSYPYVSFLFGTSMLYRFPELLYTYIIDKKRRFYLDAGDAGNIAEGIPVQRSGDRKAWVSIMYGCNNFCTYCIVPYVRGRERSRFPEDILDEIRGLAANGVKEVTLLGQNVNSYGKDLEQPCDFPTLLEKVCAIPGDFTVHFMTSHPKDASHRLIDVMAAHDKIAKHFHLPLQSGSNRVLSAMNRRYTWEMYQETLAYMRQKMPDITVTSDLIVGFPTETEEEFEETLHAVRTVRYDQIFTFIFSPRTGTPAAVMDGQISDAVKGDRMKRLLDVQNEIMLEKNQALIGKEYHILCEGRSKYNDALFSGRTEGGKLVHFAADDADIGTIVAVRITDAETFSLMGEIITAQR